MPRYSMPVCVTNIVLLYSNCFLGKDKEMAIYTSVHAWTFLNCEKSSSMPCIFSKNPNCNHSTQCMHGLCCQIWIFFKHKQLAWKMLFCCIIAMQSLCMPLIPCTKNLYQKLRQLFATAVSYLAKTSYSGMIIHSPVAYYLYYLEP